MPKTGSAAPCPSQSAPRDDPQQERCERANEPKGPALSQRCIQSEEASINSASSDYETGKEVNGILRRETGLNREWPECDPLPGFKERGQGQINHRRDDYEADEEALRMAADVSGEPA